MEIKKINYQDFMSNTNFFKKNLPFVFEAYDNSEKSKCEIEKSFINGYKKFFEEYKDNCFLIMAVENNKMYSMVTFEKQNSGVWYIDSMVTRTEKRGQHLATAVLKKGLSEIIGTCCLHVYKDNVKAISLYKKMGFNEEENLSLVNFNPQNSYLMSKEIIKYKICEKGGEK